MLVLAVFGYAAYFLGGSPDRDVLYQYEVAIGTTIIYTIMLGLVLAIAGRERELLALRRPRSWGRTLGLALVVLVAVFVLTGLLEAVLNGGEEQGLTPTGWRPEAAGAYVANFVVLAGFVPVVEELTYRGLGYSLLAGYGQWPAILIVGAVFAADHGLVRAFPALFVFGCGLAWLRAKTDTVYPCIAIHAAFNAAALIFAVISG